MYKIIMNNFDLEKINMKSNKGLVNGTKNHRFAPGEKFLRGPIPLVWLSQAASLPGHAINVALALWFLKGLTKSNTVRLGRTVSKYFCIERQAGYRGLRALERAGLVICKRSSGSRPIITILESPVIINGNGNEGSMTRGDHEEMY